MDAGNAHEMEEGIAGLRKEDPQAQLTLDAIDLSYISSAGLRVVMRLLKQLGP